MSDGSEREITVAERPQVPWLSVVLGFGPMLPLVVGAAAAWLSAGRFRAEVTALTVIWAGTILAFVSGVRRGLSFRTEGGATAAQIATVFALFVVAFAAFVTLESGRAAVAAALLLVGFAAALVLDPVAAARGEAPEFFARLRPPQFAIAVASLAALLADALLAR